MRVKLFYEVVIEDVDQLACDNLSMEIEEMLKDLDGVESAIITVEEELK